MTYEELKKKQVGGKHYKFAVQPWDFYRGGALSHNEWVGYLKGNIIDYLVRKKNGFEDLQKAQHLLDVLVATEEEHEEAVPGEFVYNHIDGKPVRGEERRTGSADRRKCFAGQTTGLRRGSR